MPVGVVKTKAQHKKWKKAKKIVEEQHGEMRWPLVMHIFQQMSKEEKPDKNVLIERALESQGKKTTIPPEFHQHLSQWWAKNKASALTPEQQERMESIKQAKQRRNQFKVIKSAKELDYLEKKLNIIKSEIENLFKNDDSKFENWKPKNWDPSSHPDTKHLIDLFGFHPREAGFLAGVDTNNMASSSKHFRPTPMSEGFLKLAKEVAKNKFEQVEAKRKADADPKYNPDLHVSHHAKEIHQGFNGNFEEALKNFKESPEFQQIPASQRPMHIMKWKADWHKNNLENQKQAAQNAANIHGKIAANARDQREKELLEQRKNILMGGVGDVASKPSSFESAGLGYQDDHDQEDDDFLKDLEGY